MTLADFARCVMCETPDACTRAARCGIRTAAAMDTLIASDAHIIADPDYGLPPRARILRDAERLICGDREADYGPPADSFARAAALASLATGHHLTPRDVVEVLLAVKTSRLRQQRDHADGLVDRIGYAALAAEVSDSFADTLAALGGDDGRIPWKATE